jgi:hypothetical protein
VRPGWFWLRVVGVRLRLADVRADHDCNWFWDKAICLNCKQIILSDVKGICEQPAKVRPRKLSVHLGSYLDVVRGDLRDEAPGTQAQLSWVRERAGRNASET